MRGLW